MDPYQLFKKTCAEEIASQNDPNLRQSLYSLMFNTKLAKYAYHFEWSGRPVIQLPQDMIALQEIIWQTRPDLIIETGIAHGGSLMFSASMLTLLDYCDAAEKKENIDPGKPARMVLGIDIDIREHNREFIEKHPLAGRVKMIEGSSVDKNTIRQVEEYAGKFKNIMVCLDSNHTHDHVLQELNAYAHLVNINNYCIVWDTSIEEVWDMLKSNKEISLELNRPWGKGNNPYSAVQEFLSQTDNFILDEFIEHKLVLTSAKGGFLKRVK